LKEGDIVSIGAISSMIGPAAVLDSYSNIKPGTATHVSTAASGSQTSGAKTQSASSETAQPAGDGSGTGLSTIEAAVQTFMSDYQNVYGSGRAADLPPESGMSDFDMAQLTSALRAMSRDFSQFFGPALGNDVQPFGLPLSSTQSLADVQATEAAKAAIRSSGSAGQTTAPVVQPANEAGQAPMAVTDLQHIAVSSYAAVSVGGPASKTSGT
jgi:hypothetical protein